MKAFSRKEGVLHEGGRTDYYSLGRKEILDGLWTLAESVQIPRVEKKVGGQGTVWHGVCPSSSRDGRGEIAESKCRDDEFGVG